MPVIVPQEAESASARERPCECSCTVRAGIARSGGDRFRMPRYNVLDWPADEFQERLLTWLGG